MNIWIRTALFAACASIAWAQPSIATGGIVNASSYLNKLAPDTVFVIFGSGMGPGTIAIAAAPDYPATLAGTSITFTPAGGGTVIAPKMVYTVGGQICGLLPSSIAPGTYAVRVTYNGQTSAPQNVTVVARSFGIAAQNSSGRGTAQATIANINGGISLTRFTSGTAAFDGRQWVLSPSHPGDTIVLWGTGGGADPLNDTGGTSGDQTAAGNFRVNVSGRLLTPLYAGASSGYPGLWQINFTLPNDIALDCFASVQVVASGEMGNTVILPIAAAGQSVCVNEQMNTAALAKLDANQDLVTGAFAMARQGSTPNSAATDTLSGAFFKFSTDSWMRLNTGPKFDQCVLNDRTYPRGTPEPGAPSVSYDAGTRLPFSGPNVTSGAAAVVGAASFGPFYSYTPPTNLWQNGGVYTLTGPGGPQVGAFTVSTTFPSSFNPTNWDSILTIDRAVPLTFTWTGSGFPQVYIQVTTNSIHDTLLHTATLNCYVPAGPGTYTIPPAALAYLEPAAASGTSTGSISVQAFGQRGFFTATLSGGGQTDGSVLAADLGVAKNVNVK